MTDTTQGQDAAPAAPQPEKPDVDTLFGARDVDELFPADYKPTNQPVRNVSPIQDALFSNPGRAHARILDAFGYGFKQDWGAGQKEFSEADEYLRKAGVYNDYAKGQHNVIKSANEILMRPAVAAIIAAKSTMSGAFRGAQEAVAQTGAEYGAPQLGRELAAIPEAFPTGIHAPMGIPEVPHVVNQAKALDTIGAGEAGYFGTKPVTPEPAAVVAESAKVQDVAKPEVVSGGDAEAAPSPATPAAVPVAEAAPDIHAVARQIAPKTFEEFDALAQKKDTFRRWIGELRETRDQDVAANAPHGAEIADLQSKIEDATPRLAKKYQARLDPLIEERDAYIAEHTQGDNADMAKVRTQLMETDYRMRDLGPDVSKAYRDAQERMPQTAENPQIPEEVSHETKPVEAANEQVPTEVAPAPEPVASAVETSEPTAAVKSGKKGAAASQPDALLKGAAKGAEFAGKQAAAPEKEPERLPIAYAPSIVADVSKKLQEAGRPAKEADAAAQVVAAYWETRAQRFEGKKGTSAEMYAREAPEIVAGKEKARARQPEMAQTTDTQNGRIRIRENARNTITLMKKANASTFIHESAHDWLDRMLGDARDADAPAVLKSDSDTVMKWLGVDNPDVIKTRHHEKFARAFETYMMEGRAPSQGLARVFVKFKDWLTTIYKTVSALRAPISDDIRSVFDRLLAEKPERTVIAPEREAGASLAERHEALVENTPADQAHEVANTIRDERDTHAAQNQVDQADNEARLAETGASPERSAPRGAEPSGDANAPGSVGGEAETFVRSGEVGARGGQATGEGLGARSEKLNPLDPNAPLPRSETRLIDKAGNIRLDNLGTPEDVNAVIRQTAAENNDFIEGRRGVIPDAEVVKLADALGMDASKLSERKLGEAFNAEQVVAARKLLIQSAQTVRDAMGKAAEGDEAAILAYAEAKSRHLMIQEQVSGITAEAGRALRAFRALEGQQEAAAIGAFLQDTTGKTLYQLQREAQMGLALETPQQVSKFVQDTSKPTYKDMAIEAWMASLLSGPRTHVANILGNSITSIWRPLETATAAAIGEVRAALGLGADERVHLHEAGAEIFGMVQGAQEGLIAAKKAFLTEEPQLTATRQAEKPHQKAIPGVAGTIVRTPMRLLGAEDEFFKAIAFRGDIYRQAYVKAAGEGLSPELMRQRVAELSMSPTEEMIEAAKKVADYQTFQNALGKTGRAISAFSNSHPLAKVIVPFVRTPINLLKYASERSPLGLFAQEVRDNLAGKNGEVMRDTQSARILLGTMVGVTAFSMAAQGLITGGGPADKGKKAIMQANGWQPYSVKIGDMYYSYNRLDPFSVTLGTAVDAYEIMTAVGSDHPNKEHLLSLTFAAITKNVLNRTALQGISDLNQASSDPERYFKNYVKGLAGTVVPAISAQTTQTMDPTLREARTIVDNLKSRVPGLSQTLMPKRDVWGEPIVREGGLGPDIASPIAEARLKNDPVNKALLDAGFYPSTLERKIRGVDLTDQQYDDYSRLAGRMAKMRLNAFVNTPGLSTLPKQVRADKMREIVNSARETARSTILMQNTDIIRKANDAKLAKFKAEPVH